MRTAAAPLAACGWRTVVNGGSALAAAVVSSKPVTDTSSGTREAQRVGGGEHADGHLVAHAQHGGRPVGTAQQVGRHRGHGGTVVGEAVDDGDGVGVDAVLAERGAVAGVTPLGDGVDGAVGERLEGDDRQAPVAEPDDVGGDVVGAALLLDADDRFVRRGATVQHDHREAAILDDRSSLVVERVAVGDEPVDDGRADGVMGGVVVGAAGDQHEGDPGLVAGLGDAAEHEQRGGIGERRGE